MGRSAYTYDSAPGGKGLPATATRYTDGLAYTQAIGGYTDDYQPTSTTLTLPEPIADTWGLKTSYRYDCTYTDTGLPESTMLPAVGALPAEKLLTRYTRDGLPLSVSGKDWYGAETVYSPYGQVLSWTYDGKVDRITGAGSRGKTAYVGLADKCLDLNQATPGEAVQLYPCNDTVAQKWNFAPVPDQADPNLGTLSVYDDWCVQPAGDTPGSAIATQECSGSTEQHLERLSTGQLKHVASGLCLAVKDEATDDHTPLVLVACDADSAAQLWEAQNETRHIYGAWRQPSASHPGPAGDAAPRRVGADRAPGRDPGQRPAFVPDAGRGGNAVCLPVQRFRAGRPRW